VARGKAGRLFAPRSRSKKTPQRPCRPSLSNSSWEHHRSRGDSHRAAGERFSEARIGGRRDTRQRCGPIAPRLLTGLRHAEAYEGPAEAGHCDPVTGTVPASPRPRFVHELDYWRNSARRCSSTRDTARPATERIGAESDPARLAHHRPMRCTGCDRRSCACSMNRSAVSSSFGHRDA
jgi:hypothetical protein